MPARAAVRIALPSRIAVLHDVADAVEAVAAVFIRWNDRRRTISALRRLNRTQLSDIGLEGADLDEVATRIVR